jgi:hypothetical protein
MIDTLYEIIDSVRIAYARDPRTSVFEVDVRRASGALVLSGAVSNPAAAEALHRRIGELDTTIRIRDTVRRLPEARRGFLPHGIIKAAAAPMLAGPLISESHLSQILLGNRVLVLREHGRWLQCRSVDGYVGWVHRGYVRRVTEVEARGWEAGGDVDLHLSLGAEVVSSAEVVIARLPWGARFGMRGNRAVLPDLSEGLLVGESVAFREIPKLFPPTGRAIASTALRWRGAPYLWGGTTPWGADCSGLVQAVFRTHGLELPRDSDQQASIGAELPIGESTRLLPGDLLFFAEQADRISHVAISLGGSRIVHSALGSGGVAEMDLSGRGGYERELRSLLRVVRRITERGD